MGRMKQGIRLNFFREIPPEVETGYIVRAAEIREQAYLAQEIYLSDPNFQFLLMNQERVSKKEAEKISLYNVLGCAEKVKQILGNKFPQEVGASRNVHMSFFEFGEKSICK